MNYDDLKREVEKAQETEHRNSGKIRLHHDHETYSEADLFKVGTDVYARDPSTEILMTAYAFNDDPVRQWVPAEGEEMPEDLEYALNSDEYLKFAWNKPFEWHIWKHVYGLEIRHTMWRDPMIMAYYCSLPGKLEKAGDIVGIPEDKKKQLRGKALIRRFCKPRKPTKHKPWTRETYEHSPGEWNDFKDYNVNDVEAERAIYHKLKPYDLPAWEWMIWALDQKINQAGIPINMDMVNNAVDIYEYVFSKRMERLKELTGLANPNSGAQMLPWLKEHGYVFDDLVKGHVKRGLEMADEALKECLPNEDTADLDLLVEVLTLKGEISAASPKKYYALQRATGPDGLLRNCFQFGGAQRTLRWAGRIFQPQNLPRPEKWMEKGIAIHTAAVSDLDGESIELLYDKPMDLLKSTIRPTAQAPEGELLVDADLSAIENRVLGWMASDAKILEVFANDRDPYVDFATYMYKQPYAKLIAEYKAGDSVKRTVAKPGVLGCGYMLGAGEEKENKKTGEIEATGLLGYAWNMNVKLTMEESKHSVSVWRETFSDVKEFWYEIERAAKRCVRTGKPVTCRMLVFDMKGPFLRMRLPSGRHLHYFAPRIEPKRTPWGEMRDNLTYRGLNTVGQWSRISTHPGKLTENADQAIARDLLAHGMLVANRRGIDLRLHVHDQLVGLVARKKAERALEVLIDSMCEVPVWAKGLPMGAAGFISPIFIKD